MKQKEEYEASSSIYPIIIVHSPQHSLITPSKSSERGHYADNLAFLHDEEALLAKNVGDIYNNLTEPVTNKHVLISSTKPTRVALSKSVIWKAVLAGALLALCLILTFSLNEYLTIELLEPLEPKPLSSPLSFRSGLPLSFSKIPPRMLRINTPTPPAAAVEPSKTTWLVDYDLPPGIPIVHMHANEMNNESPATCPHDKFALSLHIEDSNSALAENWFKVCGNNVAYFRIDGNANANDIDRLLLHLKNTQFLPLKATLKVGKGENILDNPDFIKTKKSDEVIRNIEISGYVTPKTIQELVEAVPYTEELTIKGDEVCKSLKKSLKNPAICGEMGKMSWQVLQKLHIFQTHECNGMYDLIYSCWELPQLETVQIRQSMISGINGNFIKGILDKYMIRKVDFADNVCFDDTLKSYPFMCQASM